MNKFKIGIFLSLVAAMGLFTSCKKAREPHKFVLNEVMLQNTDNFQDDYGVHQPWIELFNRTFGNANLAGYYIKSSTGGGDTLVYRIPKGDEKTNIPPRQHALFWADGKPFNGTFHTTITFNPAQSTWIGLYDSGNHLIDNVTIPANTLKENQSYGRTEDAADKWEVKSGDATHYVTPDTNNKVIERNLKMEKFQKEDDKGVGMAITAMSVVFLALLLLYICFKCIGNFSVKMGKKGSKEESKCSDETCSCHKSNGRNNDEEVYAAIAMALHEMTDEVHDNEEMVLTIRRSNQPSQWSSKINTLRQMPQR